jgi:hypothetical protein
METLHTILHVDGMALLSVEHSWKMQKLLLWSLLPLSFGSSKVFVATPQPAPRLVLLHSYGVTTRQKAIYLQQLQHVESFYWCQMHIGSQ